MLVPTVGAFGAILEAVGKDGDTDGNGMMMAMFLLALEFDTDLAPGLER